MKKTSPTSKGLYQWTRKLHLYIGMFICPFILVYAVSTLYLNHSVRPQTVDQAQAPISIQVDQNAKGPELVKQVLEQLELTGEIAGGGQVRNNETIIRVARPGSVKVVTVNLLEQQATILERSNGLLGAINYLHFNPGLHRVPNWSITKLWGWLADSVVYFTLFLTVSGIYLWILLKAERKMGLFLLGGGVASFVSIVAALIYI
ncbi:MAG: PepSY-associated TM helix domain-containing protein [Verrucomicrobia bacterium]|nr:PepSY-associated TM helix domain-containing protein [Verrucomicrobiota bacterium]MDA1066472.1 PepSY-associated TM helix domain-containing protein [Verrucomicrobiota bacterium]